MCNHLHECPAQRERPKLCWRGMQSFTDEEVDRWEHLQDGADPRECAFQQSQAGSCMTSSSGHALHGRRPLLMQLPQQEQVAAF